VEVGLDEYSEWVVIALLKGGQEGARLREWEYFRPGAPADQESHLQFLVALPEHLSSELFVDLC